MPTAAKEGARNLSWEEQVARRQNPPPPEPPPIPLPVVPSQRVPDADIATADVAPAARTYLRQLVDGPGWVDVTLHVSQGHDLKDVTRPTRSTTVTASRFEAATSEHVAREWHLLASWTRSGEPGDENSGADGTPVKARTWAWDDAWVLFLRHDQGGPATYWFRTTSSKEAKAWRNEPPAAGESDPAADRELALLLHNELRGRLIYTTRRQGFRDRYYCTVPRTDGEAAEHGNYWHDGSTDTLAAHAEAHQRGAHDHTHSTAPFAIEVPH